MRLAFTKMHGIGNDFVVLDQTGEACALSAAQVRTLADRRRGVGFDQLLVARPATEVGADLRMLIYNADGSEARQCGNGARCFALHAHERGLARGADMTVQTAGGLLRARVLEGGEVSVEMGVPDLEPSAIPLLADHRAPRYELDVDGVAVTVGAAAIGNPHAVVGVDDVDSAPVARLGAELQAARWFPEGVNVGFMQVLGSGHIRLRVFERGVGETQACGSGACAAAVIGHEQGLLNGDVRVGLPGGDLRVRWDGAGEQVHMSGPAATVFEGMIEI